MTDARPPLPSDQVDELLSAELDNDFDAAAHDLGLDPADARARLATTPDIAARRAALASARDALTEVPDYDELLAARLRAKATTAAANVQRDLASERTRRRNGWLVAVGSVAAAIIVIAGLATLLNRSDAQHASKNSSANSALVPAAAPASVPPGLPLLGTASDVKGLGDALRSKLDSSAAFGTPSAADSASSPQKNASMDLKRNGSATVPTALVPSSCRSQGQAFAGLAPSAQPLEVGTATVAGKPVLVEIFRRAGNGAAPDSDILVVMNPACELLLQQTWPLRPDHARVRACTLPARGSLIHYERLDYRHRRRHRAQCVDGARTHRRPCILGHAAVVFGLLAALIAVPAAILLVIGLFRVLVIVEQGYVWAAWMSLGGIFVVAGGFLWVKRNS